MSQGDCKTKTIDGTKYGVYMLPPKLARKMLVRIFQVLAPSAGELFGRESEQLSKAIGPTLATLADRLSDDDLDWMMGELAKVSTVEMAPNKEPALGQIFDVHFMGRIGHMLKWFAFALEVQYSDFWSGSGSGLNDLLATVKAAMASPSPSTSTGSSGDPLSQKDAA